MSDITIPDDIQRAVRDRGGVEAIEAENASRKITTEEEPQ